MCAWNLDCCVFSQNFESQCCFPFREELEFIANTLIFVLAGVIIAGNIYQSEHSSASPFEIKGRDYGYAVLLWVVLLVSIVLIPAQNGK